MRRHRLNLRAQLGQIPGITAVKAKNFSKVQLDFRACTTIGPLRPLYVKRVDTNTIKQEQKIVTRGCSVRVFGLSVKVVGISQQATLTAHETFHQGFSKCYHNT